MYYNIIYILYYTYFYVTYIYICYAIQYCAPEAGCF